MFAGEIRGVRGGREVEPALLRAAGTTWRSIDDGVVVDHTDMITRSTQGRSEPAEQVFRATPASTRAIRSFVGDALGAARARPDVIADLQLVVSELAANAIEHGVGEHLTIGIDGTHPGWWEVTVSSTVGAGRLEAARDWMIADAGAGSGRGLGIVRLLMDDVRVDGRGDRLSVRCRIRR